MIKRVFVLAMLIPTIAGASEWLEIVRNNKGVLYVSENVSKDALDRYLVWVKMDENLKNNKTQTTKMLKVIDCEKRQIGSSELKKYNYKGQLIDEITTPYLMAQMESPDPDSFQFKLLKEVCHQNGY